MCFRCDLGECQQVGSCIVRGSGSVKKFKSLLGVRKLNPLLVVDWKCKEVENFVLL